MTYRFGLFELNDREKALRRSGILIALPPKVIDTLLVLVEHAGELVDKQHLFERVWPGTFLAESSLTKNISILRKVLDEDTPGESAIQTVSKRGYRFRMAVERLETAETPARKFDARRSWLLLALSGALALAAVLYWRPTSANTVLTNADREYLIGRHMWNKLDPAEMQKALQRFQKAVELEPRSALAHAGVADAYVMMTTLGLGRAEVNLSNARTSAQRAVALDGRLARPHVSLGQVRVLADFDWQGAEKEFRRAIDLESDSAPAHHGYACLLAHCGRLTEARAEIRRAQHLDPVSPLIGVAAARIEYYDRRYEHAIEMLREVLEREPSFSQAHYYLAMSLGQLGRAEEALQHLRQARVHSSLTATEEAWLISMNGTRDRAQALLSERRELVATGRAGPVSMLLPAVDSGEIDLAFESLDEMYRARRMELVMLKVNPRFDPLRSDPRFAALVRRIWPDQ